MNLCLDLYRLQILGEAVQPHHVYVIWDSDLVWPSYIQAICGRPCRTYCITHLEIKNKKEKIQNPSTRKKIGKDILFMSKDLMGNDKLIEYAKLKH